jgi:hypothetical protein
MGLNDDESFPVEKILGNKASEEEIVSDCMHKKIGVIVE